MHVEQLKCLYEVVCMCYIGPALHNNGYGDLKLMILDDDLLLLPQWAKTVSSLLNYLDIKKSYTLVDVDALLVQKLLCLFEFIYSFHSL